MSLGLINDRGLVVELLPSLALLLGVSPVSYTHLDVYKRQIISFIIVSGRIRIEIYMCLEYQVITWICKSFQIVTAFFPSSGRAEFVSANYDGRFSIYSADGINAGLGYVNPWCRRQHFVGLIHDVVTPDIFIVFKLFCQFLPYVTEIVNSASCITNDCILIIL